MTSISFSYRTSAYPKISGLNATVSVVARTTDNPPADVLVDDVGDEHEVTATDGATPEAQALLGVKLLLQDIAARRGMGSVPLDNIVQAS